MRPPTKHKQLIFKILTKIHLEYLIFKSRKVPASRPFFWSVFLKDLLLYFYYIFTNNFLYLTIFHCGILANHCIKTSLQRKIYRLTLNSAFLAPSYIAIIQLRNSKTPLIIDFQLIRKLKNQSKLDKLKVLVTMK